MVVDDDKFILASIQRSLKKQHWQIETFFDSDVALEQMRNQQYDLIMSDYQMPGTNGIKFLTETRMLQPTAIRILLSGQDNIEHTENDVAQAGIYSFISKPIRSDELIAIVNQARQNLV